MIYRNGISEINKYIVGLSSWYPSELYLAICSGSTPITRVNGYYSFNIENEFSTRIPLTTSLWHVQAKNGYGDINHASYSGLVNIGPFSYDVNIGNYFITDSPHIGSGFIINYGGINQTLTANNTASLSGLNIRFSNGGGASLPDLGFVYRGVLTSTGIRNIQRHYLGIQPLTAGTLNIEWLQVNASGTFGSNSTALTSFLSNDSGGFIYMTGVIYHSFTSLPAPTGYIGTAGLNINSTRYMNLTPNDAGSTTFGKYINEVNRCSTWFSSVQQADQSEQRSLALSFVNL